MMKKSTFLSTFLALLERKWMRPIFITILTSLVLILAAVLHLGSSSSLSYREIISTFHLNDPEEGFSKSSTLSSYGLPMPPRFAYLISGTTGEVDSMKRLLRAVYHPRNHYLLHLDREVSEKERFLLAKFVKQSSPFREVGNVHIVGKGNVVSFKGPSMIASILHGAAILLRYSKHWDWFINLSAADYPLVTQDGTYSLLNYYVFFSIGMVCTHENHSSILQICSMYSHIYPRISTLLHTQVISAGESELCIN